MHGPYQIFANGRYTIIPNEPDLKKVIDRAYNFGNPGEKIFIQDDKGQIVLSFSKH